jgi:hypothetical protein
MRGQEFTRNRAVSVALLVVTVGLLLPSVALAQLDTKHWIPALWGNYNNTHCLMMTTPEVDPVDVTVWGGDDKIVWSGQIDNSTPAGLRLLGGWLCGLHTVTRNGPSTAVNLMAGTGSLNKVSVHGLRVEASSPIYANIRHNVNYQAGSLTAKGKKALGQLFRVGFMRDLKAGSSNRSLFLSVMASQDQTTITIDDFKPGIYFYGAAASGSPATTDPITIILQANETYVIGMRGPFSGLSRGHQ